ncbi:MAG: GNAT family N-acetyltransferase [Alphaproteobacteria bacterium]|nr:GNAT family N-acetyltransferase [Alphaproteobacteria bacterium]
MAATQDAQKTSSTARASAAKRGVEVSVRPAKAVDLPDVVAYDERNTGVAKPDYWRDLYDRYAKRGGDQSFFLVAEAGGRLAGYVIGEVRAWEFGSPPCGWVFAIGVDPGLRLQNVGTRLIDAISDAFRKAGVAKLRTMVARNDNLNLSFFRSQGMMAGPFIQLETDLD